MVPKVGGVYLSQGLVHPEKFWVLFSAKAFLDSIRSFLSPWSFKAAANCSRFPDTLGFIPLVICVVFPPLVH